MVKCFLRKHELSQVQSPEFTHTKKKVYDPKGSEKIEEIGELGGQILRSNSQCFP